MSEVVCHLDLQSGASVTLRKASNGLGRGVRFELLVSEHGGYALAALTPAEALQLALQINAAIPPLQLEQTITHGMVRR